MEPAAEEPVAEKPVAEEPPIQLESGELLLENPGGQPIALRVKTTLGRSAVKQFGEDARFWSEPQFNLIKLGTIWKVMHHDDAKNETILNGKSFKGTQTLNDGDELAVGHEAKAIIKLPLKVRIGK